MGIKVKVFAGPKDYDLRRLYFEEADEFLVGVDSGLDQMIAADLRIDLAVGDFDSIDPANLERVRRTAGFCVELDKEKNMTDLAFALDHIYNHIVYDAIEVFGGVGGRVDHLMANINLLKKYDLTFRDERNKLYVLKKGSHKIANFHRYVSFFAIEDCYNLSIKGFRYEITNYYLSTSDSICVSNEGSGEVAFSKGKLLVIETDEPDGGKE